MYNEILSTYENIATQYPELVVIFRYLMYGIAAMVSAALIAVITTPAVRVLAQNWVR